jgi:flagellar biosynthesis protein FlhF
MSTSKTTRTYRADTMRDALELVRKDLGGRAVILHTREVRRRRWFGRGWWERVEVVAAPERETPAIPRAKPGVVPVPTPAASAPPAILDGELRQLHEAVAALSRQGRVDHLLPELPAALVPAYAALVDADVPEPLARRLVRQVAMAVEPEDLDRPEILRDAVHAAVADSLSIAPPIAVVPGTRRIVALVGPTGVGKTTTVAKLAASFKLARNLSVGLITVDTFRIAAVEQLRTYAQIIGLPLAVVGEPGGMAEALETLGPVDLVLIDTAGRSPRDEVRIRELADFLAEANPDEVHLVLSAVATERSLRAAIERFDSVRADRLILTKLDEADGLGAILGVLAQAHRPVGYLTTGQAVPDDIEPARRDRLARLILGDDVVA